MFTDPFGLCPPKDASPCTGQDLINQVAGRVQGLETAVTVGLAVQLAPLAVAGAAELAVGGGMTTLDIAQPVISNSERALLRDFFGKGLKGAAERAGDFKIPDGLGAETLKNYAKLAARAIAQDIDKQGVQAARLKLIERALKALE